MPVPPPRLVALHLGWGQAANGGMAESGRARVAKAEKNIAINAKHRFLSTSKTHKAAQTCPEHAVVLEPKCLPAGHSTPLWDALPSPAT